jgi:plastocyanin
MVTLRSIALPALAAVVIAVVALGVRESPPAQPETRAAAGTVHSGHVSVQITDYAFVPDHLTVRAGTRITFINHDATAHTATANGGGFDTGTVAPHASATIRVTRAGTYGYHCVFHAFMTGTLTVVGR